jgi:hypothetical protein
VQDAGDEAQPVDPDDADDSNPLPKIVDGPYADVYPECAGQIDRVCFKLGADIKLMGAVHPGIVTGDVKGPFPYTTQPYPRDARLGADGDQDGVPGTVEIVYYQTTFTGPKAFTSEAYSVPYPLDPDDADDSNPLPKVVDGPYADVYPLAEGKWDRVGYKLGLRLKYLGQTYDGVVEGVHDGPLPVSFAYPTLASQTISDADGDGVVAGVVIARRAMTVHEDGTITSGMADPIALRLDPDDNDPDQPIPPVGPIGPIFVPIPGKGMVEISVLAT